MGKFLPNCEIGAIHIQSDFADKAPREFLQMMAAQYPQIPFYFKDVAVEGRLKEGHKLNCYSSSTPKTPTFASSLAPANFLRRLTANLSAKKSRASPRATLP